jgi:hypothetical protein
VLWDDMNPRPSYGWGNVYTNTFGPAGDRVFMVTWLNVPRYYNNGQHSFQVLLYEATGEIHMNYLSGSPYSSLTPTIGLNKGDGVRYNQELYGSGYGSTFGLPQSFKYYNLVPRTFWADIDVDVDNVNPTIDKFEVSVPIEIRAMTMSHKWQTVKVELYENNILVATTQLNRAPGDTSTATVLSAPIQYNFMLNKKYDVKLHYTASTAHLAGVCPAWVIFDWPNDDHSSNPTWSMTSLNLGDHDDYWQEQFNIAHGGAYQVRSLWMDPVQFFQGHTVDVTALATDPGSDDLNFTYYSSLYIPPIRTKDHYNNGVTPEPAAPPSWTPFTGTAPFVVNDSHTLSYSGAQTLTLFVTDDDGGMAWKSFVIT